MRPSVFLSDVTKLEGGDETRVKISMNEPLRHEGYTFFQTSWGPQLREFDPSRTLYSVLAVVVNPSDQWPKWSCYVIGLGLLLHFAMKLLRYIRSESQAAALRAARAEGRS
jgi:hypothetical protein